MADARNVFAAGAKLHRHDALGNQFAGHRADDVHAQNFIGRGIGQHLDHAGGITQGTGAAIGQEREGPGAVGATSGLELLLGLTDPGDFRIGVDDPRDGVEVDMAVLARHALGHGNALLLGLVREHRAAHHIANRPDAAQVAAAIAINHDRATLVELQANRVSVETHGVGHAANRDDQLVHIERLRLALGVGPGDVHCLFADLDRANGDAEFDLQALFDESLVRLFRNLLIHGAEKLRQRFQNRHFSTEAAPDRTHLQADHARADQAQLFRQRADAQRAVVR